MKTKSVKEGESVTLDPGVGDSVSLHTDVETIQQEEIRWYFNEIHIAEITGDSNETCTDVKCKDGKERFRDRLKVNYMTGSLTITNIRTTDSGLFKLQNNSSSESLVQLFSVSVYYKMKTKSVKEGESVTLDPGVCNNGTGSLTITNTRTTDSGLYTLQINSSSESLVQLFSVSVYYAPEQDKMKTKSVKEGESVTLDPGVVKTTNYLMKWLFNGIRITEINGDISFNCTDVQCNNGAERFRGRLRLDHQTGSLTIRDIRTTDSGLYNNQVISGSSLTKNEGVVSGTAVHGLCTENTYEHHHCVCHATLFRFRA
uniref:Immunoglobulin domain-containing protein n=1 Tax=Sinocyclocheilus anshuiensis TaxID=1608454 RepID=A0A671R191_9TELE